MNSFFPGYRLPKKLIPKKNISPSDIQNIIFRNLGDPDKALQEIVEIK